MNSYIDATLKQQEGGPLDIRAVNEALTLHKAEEAAAVPEIARSGFTGHEERFILLYKGDGEVYDRLRRLIIDQKYWRREAYHFSQLMSFVEEWNFDRGKVDQLHGNPIDELVAPPMNVMESWCVKNMAQEERAYLRTSTLGILNQSA